MAAVKAEGEFRWGIRAYNSGYFNKAILSFEKSLNIKRNNLLTRTWLAKAYYKSGYVEQALNLWNDILKEGPGNSLLQQKVDSIVFRRGLGKELTGKVRYVISDKIDASQPGYYPFKKPAGVYSAKDGTEYIACFGSNEILKIDINNRITGILRGGIEGFDHPFDILENNGFLYISEYERNSIVKYKLNGKKIKTFGATGTGPGELLGPQYLAVDGKGYIYVSDWGNGRINKYDLDGQFILSFSKGLSGPTGIAVNGNEVFVADRLKKDISVFDLSGNLLRQFGKGFLKDPEGIYMENEDKLLVTDANRVLEYKLENDTWKILGDTESYAVRLAGISLTANGNIFTTDFSGNRMFVLTDMSSLYNSFSVNIEKVNAINFPEVIMDVSVRNRYGKPIVGLTNDNFIVTESYTPVDNLSIVKTNTEPQPLNIVLLIEKAPGMDNLSEPLREAITDIYDAMDGRGKIEVVSTGENPAIESKMGADKLKLIEAATKTATSRSWHFDKGLKIAAADLIPREGRKSVIYLGRGVFNNRSFNDYSLIELSNYLMNNFIDFYTVSLDKNKPDKELRFITKQTGGKAYSLLSPGGIKNITDDIAHKAAPVYTLSFTSHSESDFGRKYIKLTSEVTVQKKSGRDESGYYAPLKF